MSRVPSVRRDLLPPLAPPVAADQDAQLRVPAVGDVPVGVKVVQTVVAPLAAVGLAAQDRVLGEMAELHAQLLVDGLRFRRADIVDGCGLAHLAPPGLRSPNARKAYPRGP